MSLPGRKPAAAGQSRNKNRQVADWVEVEDAPYVGDVPELPEFRTVLTREGQTRVEFQPMTRDWWRTVSSMPHCRLWAESDWMFALATAQVADAAFCGVASAATELRNREKVMGTTVEYRRDLRIRYVEPKELSKPAEVARLADYRDL